MVDVSNPYVAQALDRAQRRELVAYIKGAPDTELGAWLKQHLDAAGRGHIPTHDDHVGAVLLAVMATEITELRQRLQRLEARQ